MQNAQTASISCSKLDPGPVRILSILDSSRLLCEDNCLLIDSKIGGVSSRCAILLFRSRDTASTLAAMRTELPLLNNLGRHL